MVRRHGILLQRLVFSLYFSLYLTISCQPLSFLSISVFSLYLSSATTISSPTVNGLILVRPTLFLTMIVHVILIDNGIGARYTIPKALIFFIHAIIPLLDCLWQILDCLWNVCVFKEYIFFVLIFLFGCRESAEKMPRNTSPIVILLRAKWNFSSFNQRLLVNSSQQYLPKYL